MNQRWLKPSEAADYARIGESTLRQWIAEGLIKPAVTRHKKNVHSRGAAGYVIDSRDLDLILEGLKQDVSVDPETRRKNLDRRFNRSRNPRSST